MAQFSATKGQYDDRAFAILPSDIYRMKIVKADIQQNQFAEPNDDGTYPDQLVLCWEVSAAIGEQDESVIGLSVWQRLAPWYGVGKRGPSKFKLLIDSLIEQGIFDPIDPDTMDTDWFLGIEQRVNVEEYIKTMGKNTGQPGNRIVNILPLTVAKKPVKTTAPAATPPAPAAQPAPRAPRRNAPQTIESDEDLPF